MSNTNKIATKMNADAVAIVKLHKHVVTLAKCVGADDKARAKIGELMRKGDLTTTAQAVDMANRCERAMEAVGLVPTANGLRMSYGKELDLECGNADTRAMLRKMREACATIRASHAASKIVTVEAETVEAETVEAV